MCYENRFYRAARKKAQQHDEVKPVIERTASTPEPTRRTPVTETKRRKEVETELETA